MLTALPFLALLGCEPAPVQEVHEGPLDSSWIAQIVADPAAFSAVVDADRSGWIALHGNDLPTASGGDGPAAARGLAALSALHITLGRLGSAAWQSTAATWEARSGLPEGSAMPWFVALAAKDAGEASLAGAWLERAVEGGSPDASAAADALRQGDTGRPDVRENPLLGLYLRHMELRDGAEGMADVTAAAARPVYEEPGESGDARAFYDPQIHWTLAEVYRPEPAALPSGLAGVMFSPCLSEVDLEADRQRLSEGGSLGTLCARGESWAALGLDTELGAEDDPESARAYVRALDRQLDPWAKALSDGASPEGRELLEQLGLVPLFRSQALLSRARLALEAEHPRQALALAQLALDLEHPRDLSPVNAPGLFAVLAESNLLTGHTREALDALQVLVEVFPEATGVDEVVGDLAILKVMDRHGDSKEH